jgi:hypothetical protein
MKFRKPTRQYVYGVAGGLGIGIAIALSYDFAPGFSVPVEYLDSSWL